MPRHIDEDQQAKDAWERARIADIDPDFVPHPGIELVSDPSGVPCKEYFLGSGIEVLDQAREICRRVGGVPVVSIVLPEGIELPPNPHIDDPRHHHIFGSESATIAKSGT